MIARINESGAAYSSLTCTAMKLKFPILVVILLVTQVGAAYQEVPWTWQKSECKDCGINFRMSTQDYKDNPKMVEFLQALSTEKHNILKLYNSDPQEYNLLAHMAVGILGNESTYFKSMRYKVKRNTQLPIQWAKDLKAWFGDYEASPNSKGPTQIKKVPDRIEQFYNITEKNLWNPKYAAVSTMAFLIEALVELKQRAKNNNLEMITPETYVDYLPYIYFGGSKKLVNRTATPDTNIYVKNMKKNMKKVSVLEIIP